jgi:hypothetical protein
MTLRQCSAADRNVGSDFTDFIGARTDYRTIRFSGT